MEVRPIGRSFFSVLAFVECSTFLFIDDAHRYLGIASERMPYASGDEVSCQDKAVPAGVGNVAELQ